jgi:beta-site APP-cleaving enzyme 1 (memapsin 2)
MLVDTGSANTAVAYAPDPALGDYEIFDQSLSGKDFIDVGKAVKVTYSSGEWSGILVKDKVGFAEFSMEMSHFSLITSSTDFFIEGAEWVGILGMAYQSLAKPDSSVGTVWDSIRRPNALQDVFALQLCPPRESTLFPGTFVKQGGYMTLGGINSSLYQVGKQFHYTRIVEERFYSILLTKVAVGEKVIDISCKKVYVHMIIIERA